MVNDEFTQQHPMRNAETMSLTHVLLNNAVGHPSPSEFGVQ